MSEWKTRSTASPSTGSSQASAVSSKRSSNGGTNESLKSTTTKKLLHKEDFRAALLNKLFPRNCETLNILGHELKPLANYPGFLCLRAVYSLLVEKSMKQFSCDMIAKMLPETLDKQRQFEREIAFYRYVEPELRSVIMQMMQSPLPRCYLARGECEKPKHRNPSLPKRKGPPEPGCDIEMAAPVLILQDLAQEGMKKAYMQKEMDYHHCASALRALAQFHAISAVIDRSDAKLKRGSYLSTAFPFLIPQQEMFSETEKLYDEGMKIIAALGPHMDPKILLPERDVPKVVFFLKRNLHCIMVDILKPHETQLNTLCHANCRNVSNFMYVQDQKHRPGLCKLIGLSQVRYCRPALDISLVLFCAADREVRQTKTHILIELYREEFNKTLERCKKKHHSALPFSAGLLSSEQLNDAIYGTKLYAVALRAFTVATQVTASNSMSATDKALREFSRNDEYRANVTEAVSDLLAAIEPYAGDCSLKSQHRECPHFLPAKYKIPKNPAATKTTNKDKKK